jgi:membrane protease YdiL (CAAX protease family)
MMKERSLVRRYPLVLFFVLAYAFSWGNYFLARTFPGVPFLFPFGPLLAALITASVTGGVGGLKDLASRCLRWRVGLQWYAAALIVPALIGLAAIALSVLLGGPGPAAARLGPWYSLFLLFPLALWDAPFGEETGWRGFALPRFPADRSPLFNSLILGLLVMGWHLPLVLAEPTMIAPYVLAGIASAILTNWIYYNTRGSALLAMLYHSAANTVGLYFAPMLAGPDEVRYFWLLAAVNWTVAGAVILLTGSTLRRGPISPEAVHVSQSPPAKEH